MPARWVDLLMRLEHTLDQADAELSASDRTLFMDRALQFVVTHRKQPAFPEARHPLPAGDPLNSRDPSGPSSDEHGD